MTVEVLLAVNNSNGDVTSECQALEIQVDGEMVMYFDVEFENPVSFLEIPDDYIQIENDIFKYEERDTMVGNVYWNKYRILCAEVCRLLNHLQAEVKSRMFVLVEAESSLYGIWTERRPYTVDDFNALIANPE